MTWVAPALGVGLTGAAGPLLVAAAVVAAAVVAALLAAALVVPLEVMVAVEPQAASRPRAAVPPASRSKDRRESALVSLIDGFLSSTPARRGRGRLSTRQVGTTATDKGTTAE
jgi:hypothetical protein